MIVRIKLFAAARELTDADELPVELPAGASFGDLRAKLAADQPRLAAVCGRALFAADARYVDDKEPVRTTAEIALIPPVSGG